jgi:aspartyl/asparaginyl beta-hydroxylase (cupin superfamily)
MEITGFNKALKTHIFGEVTIFRLAPGAHLRAHVGAHNMRLTAHLGLIVPEGPIIYVGDTPVR